MANLMIPDQFLLDQGIKPFVDLPFWIPESAEDYRGFFAINNAKALKAGLTLRSLAETIRDTALSLDLMQTCEGRGKQVGLDSERERTVKEAWN